VLGDRTPTVTRIRREEAIDVFVGGGEKSEHIDSRYRAGYKNGGVLKGLSRAQGEDLSEGKGERGTKSFANRLR